MILGVPKISSISFFLGSVSNAKVAEINTSFLGFFGFDTFLEEMIFLAKVIADNLTDVLCLVPSNGIRVGCIHPRSWDRIRVLYFVLSIPQVFLLPFLTTLFRDFYAFKVVMELKT